MSRQTSVAKCFLVVVFGLIVSWSANAQGIIQTRTIETRTIDVAGTAEVELTPDMIVWHITLTDNNDLAGLAKHSNDARLAGLIEIADDLDLPDEDVQAGTISIRRVYERDDHGNTTTFKHYSLRRQVTLILRDFEMFDEMLEKLVELQVEFSVGYDSSQRIETRADARLRAVEAARDKAKAMAEVLGQRIGRPISIEEHRGDLRWANALSNTSSGVARPEAGRRMAPGAIKVTSTVYIVFELIDE